MSVKIYDTMSEEEKLLAKTYNAIGSMMSSDFSDAFIAESFYQDVFKPLDDYYVNKGIKFLSDIFDKKDS